MRGHPFHDGDTRAGFVTMVVFLELNGQHFEAPESEVVTTLLGVAAGTVTEARLAAWIRRSSVRRSPP